MFDRKYRLYSRLLLTMDTAIVLPALYFAYHIRYYLVRFLPEEIERFFNPELLPIREYLFYLLIFIPIWFLLLMGTQFYSDLIRRKPARQFARLLNLFVAAGSAMGLAIFVFQLQISRPIFFVFIVISAGLLTCNRTIVQLMLRSGSISEHTRIKILIVGTNQRAVELARILNSAEKWGYRVIGHVRLNGEEEVGSDMKILGSVKNLPDILQRDNVPDEVIFTGNSQGELQRQEVMINLCQELGIKIRVASDLLPASASKISLEFLDNLPLITFSNVPDPGFSLVVKRVIDVTCAVLGLILLLPLMLVTAIAIKTTSPGPVFYCQNRCGLYGRRFPLTKFRTMVDGAEDRLWEIRHLNEMDGPVFKMRNDPRVTSLGSFLRRSSIDELPQLWNVIKGEMSIVGPRAPLLEEVKHYSTTQRRRLSVKPGITCLWQVSGRSNINFQRWMDMDLEYIDNWSVWLDLLIILKTIPAVFTGRGAR